MITLPIFVLQASAMLSLQQESPELALRTSTVMCVWENL